MRRRRAQRRRAPLPLHLLAWAAVVVAAVTMSWRAVRWADRNL